MIIVVEVENVPAKAEAVVVVESVIKAVAVVEACVLNHLPIQ